MRKGFYFIFLLSTLTARGQFEKRDSLLSLLPTAKEDTNKVRLLLDIAEQYENTYQDSAVYYLETSKRLSDLLGFRQGLYKYYERSAIVTFTKGNYQLSMEQSNRALEIARKMGSARLIATMLVNTGIVYQYTGHFDKQLEYLLEARKLIESVNEKDRLSGIYQNIANSYYSLHQFRRSIENSMTALSYHKQIGGNPYYNRIYASLGQNYAALKIMDSALYYYKVALVESAKVNDHYALAGIYGFMAELYAELQDFDEMLKVSETSLSLSRQLQSNQMLASSLYNIAYANYSNGNNIAAKKNIYEALEIARTEVMPDELRNIYNVLSYIAARDGDFGVSQWAMQKRDSILQAGLNHQVIATTTELHTKYETEKKNQLIKLQQAQIQNRVFLNYLLFGLAITFLIISLLSYRNYRQKRRLHQSRISELETEKQLGSTEAVLKGEEQERTRLAKDLHDGLGGMLSGIKYSLNAMKGNLIMTPDNHQAFERSMDMLDSSIKEMRRVAHNMMPEALVRFGLDTALKDYCNDLNQGGALQINYQSIGLADNSPDQTTAINIYRIVQELIGNTMKHAASTAAIVQVTNTGRLLAVTVEDDGKGFDTGDLERSKGMGWTNIRHRVDFLKGKLDVRSAPGSGTSVHIEFMI
jgi:two-component system, NarL family, sensor kinase